MYSNFIINTLKAMYSLNLTCCSSYWTMCGLPYSEYYPFICTAATVCPSVAYHILNITHSFVQQLLCAPLWPTIFWTLPVQFYNNCSLSVYGQPYTEHCPLSFTYDFYVSVWWPYSSYIYARTCKMLNFTVMYVHFDCSLNFLCSLMVLIPDNTK